MIYKDVFRPWADSNCTIWSVLLSAVVLLTIGCGKAGSNRSKDATQSEGSGATEPPKDQSTAEEVLLKWRRALLANDSKSYRECLFGIDPMVMPAYLSALESTAATHDLERVIKDRYGTEGWAQFLALKIEDVVYRPVVLDAPWLDEDSWKKEIFYEPPADNGTRKVYLPISQSPVRILPGQEGPGHLSYYRNNPANFAALLLHKKQGSWYIEVVGVTMNIDPSDIKGSVSGIVQFHRVLKGRMEKAVAAIQNQSDATLLEVKKIAFGFSE
jgi:hypothetical protein